VKLSSHFKTAMRNLSASRLRTFLAMLGIIIGTASVVALVSVGRLATEQALEQFKGLGADLMRINFSSINSSIENQILLDSIINLKTSVPGISTVAPYISQSITVNYKQQYFDNINIIASTENLAEVINITLKEGRFINDLDQDQYFCVLGKTFTEKLNSLNLIGQRIKIGTGIFTIIGVANQWAENNIVGVDINEAIIVPFASLMQITSSIQLNTAILRLKQSADIDTVKQLITNYFTKNLSGYRVDFQSGKEILNRMAKQQYIFTLLLGLIGGIALLVGGVGVMNIMLASVAERHAEIGLRIALGAGPRDVQLMFLMEAVVLGILGGLLGVISGIFATAVIAGFANWPFIILVWPSVIGFGVSLLIMLFFGSYPAYVASKLNPIEILRG
jgi:putative ABC transport system permease protein